MTVSPAAAAIERPGRLAADSRAEVLDRAEQRLVDLLGAEHAEWSAVDPRAAVPVDAIRELVRAGGKRLRPAFCAAGFLSAGGDPGDSRVADAAAAVELLHAFALIHDDVIDDSDLRRGIPTVHVQHTARHQASGWQGEPRRYGEGIAILAGDLAFSYAAQLTQELPARARQVWSRMTSEMIIGQHLDVTVAAESVPDPKLARYIANAKSGRYSIHRPLELGAALAGDASAAASFEAYGTALGEAFQLRDDLIDTYGDKDTVGKPVGADAGQHKMTLLVSLAALRDASVGELVRAAEWDAAALAEALNGNGVREEVERRIEELVAEAKGALATAPLPEEWKQELALMAEEVAFRDH
ncbi:MULTISPECIES: polyprenyl synthetase family protein [Streptomyces]|uniref:Putative trans-polyprenyl diphosphate synthetase n=1 Tax=Streptomyces albus (strain ATCC 21838 / DSM 41398 / FERM P-419 / JCM 4703 / NBRC 107858) TaxID=1081613 RepID=A0A0B5EH24_STRA4|nr:polyprenyl synthetase family protein [Streptomyces sp. SCSIO ZS0520]AJE81453.1 putative trans-polyprenyl diphosphate synthetase [Streptomyces albus]AOU75768.1 putative trans-polyprenyl diphosphate synthetase [Streptomyces albus]AYN31572.1 polyprenyl synthetase [Streptomyces albus]UFZ14067.1 trans-polyprenyl diphosphate synthetase [Streptomyces sp.]